MTLRPAVAADLSALAELERACFGDPWDEAALRGHLESPVGQTLVCLAGECVVGELLWQTIPPEWEILRVATHPDFRRRGIAAAMLDRVHAELGTRGCTSGYLEVRAGGTAARALYVSRGYTECGTRPHYYRHPDEDAVLMHLTHVPKTDEN